MNTAAEALHWREEGVAPIPLAHRSKRPLVKWTTWEEKQPPAELVKSWFAIPYRNLGIVLKDGITALDFDNAGSYFLWKREAPKELRESFSVKSGRGWHVYVKLKEPFKTIARIDRGGEVRGRGIMVVPPSIHKNGKCYQRLNESQICEVVSVDELRVRYTLAFHEEGDIGKIKGFEGDTLVSEILRNIRIDKYLSRFTNIGWNGSAWMCRCPFHNDNNPSMQINIEQGWAYCHSPHCIAHRKNSVIEIARLAWNRPVKDVLFLLASELD